MHISQVSCLEQYIERYYKSKTAFATAMGMTRQNVNYNIAKAEELDGKLPYNFLLKLKDRGIDIAAMTVGTNTDESDKEMIDFFRPLTARETGTKYVDQPKIDMKTENEFLRQRVKDLEDIIKAKDALISVLQKQTPEQVDDAQGSKRAAS